MILYFSDRKMNIVGTATTERGIGFVIDDDLLTEEIESGVATFDFTLYYEPEDRMKAKELCAAGNYVFRSSSRLFSFFTIIETEEEPSSSSITCNCEDAGLDLLNEIAGAYAATSAMTAEQYINMYIGDSGFEVGINEISNLTRTLSWDGESTVTERIRSIATQFDNAEIGYSFAIDKLKITHKYIDIYKKRGKDVGMKLFQDKEIDKIVTHESIADLATALVATGGTPEGASDVITLSGYSYDDGDIYISGGTLLSRSANRIWSRYLAEGGDTDTNGYIVRTYSYDTTSQEELCNRAISKLKSICTPTYTYDVSFAYLPGNLKLGDMIQVADDAGQIYIEARLMQTEISIANRKYSATLGDFTILSDGISEKLSEISKEIAAKKAIDAYTVTIISSAGTLFQTADITTTLTAHVYLANVEQTAAELAEKGLTVKWYEVGNATVLESGLTYQVDGATETKNIMAQVEDV